MTTGAICQFFEWEIPDFFSFHQKTIDSPRFSLAGSTWYLILFPNDDYMGVSLGHESETNTKVTCNFDLKKVDGTLAGNQTLKKLTFKGSKIWRHEKLIKLEFLKKHKSELAPLGTVTFICRIEKVDSLETRLVELESLSSDFKDLLVSGRKYDVTVNVQGKEFRAHRAVLSSRSLVFRAMYEHDTAEDESGILTIPDCDPETFCEFLDFLYTGKTSEVSYRTAYHLYTTADKYDVQRLRAFCADYLKHNLTVENVCDIIMLADRHGDQKFMSSIQDFFNQNFRNIVLTPEWAAMMENNHCLANCLLKEMASATSHNKKGKDGTICIE